VKTVGFIVNSRRPQWGALSRGLRPWYMATGWPDHGSPMHFMRFGWVAEEVNRRHNHDLRYELFKPWRDYDAVVFLKSMENGCADLADALRSRGKRVVFEANVDYYSEVASGTLPAELVPDAVQRDKAIRMTGAADAVIASSRQLAAVCAEWNTNVSWVPDNIPSRMVPAPARPPTTAGPALEIWWSGMAAKTADLLRIADVLGRLGRRVRLNIVTGDLEAALRRLPGETSSRLRSLLSAVPHRLHRFRSIPDLLALYAAAPGVIISPRFLDNPYNAAHSEWKITLGMACGLPAVASPQPSYLDVAQRCGHPQAVTLCRTDEEWEAAFAGALEGKSRAEISEAAREVVQSHYSTEVVARLHAETVHRALEKRP
jgi:glycosyltransferase involved in cell wall biosynthesis